MNIVDPTIYPVVFSLDKREVIFSDNQTATTTFQVGGGNIISSFYGYSGTYSLDVDYLATKNFIQSGKLAVFEIFGNSINMDSLSPIVKVWVDDVSFVSIENLQTKDFRHSQWIQNDTLSSVFLSPSLGAIDPVDVSGIKYYPKYVANCKFFNDYFSAFTTPEFSVSPGQSNEFSTINSGNYGILTTLISLSPLWYYDVERTILVSSVPTALDKYGSFYYSTRFFYLKTSKFNMSGSISQDGLCTFSNIMTKDFIINNSLNYGSLRYSYIKDGKISVGIEDQVIIDRNGYCAKPGKIGKVYQL